MAVHAKAPAEAGRVDGPTPRQRGTMRCLGVPEACVRRAAHGPDVFAYVEDDHSTLRLQIAPDGYVVGQTVLNREAKRPQGGEVR
jgi:hypothetical protein